MSTPVTVIGGYLGAGKTTLINSILRHADGLRIAVLVNEFGTLSIDEDLIEAQDGDVISIAGGCICCAFGDNLTGAFTELLALPQTPEHIVIEASGVAIPAALAATLSLIPHVSLAGIVVLADAETIEARARDPYMGDTIVRQLSGADLVLVTKSDLVTVTALERVSDWARSQTADAQIIPITAGRCPNEIVLGDIARQPTEPFAREDHAALYESLVFDAPPMIETTRLHAILTDSAFGLVRAKGFLRDIAGQAHDLHLVGSRMTLTPTDRSTNLALVCIGMKKRLRSAELIAQLEALGCVERKGV